MFITFSSVKAAADSLSGTLYENHNCNPQTHYGKSKLLAEQYILSKKIPNSYIFKAHLRRNSLSWNFGNKDRAQGKDETKRPINVHWKGLPEKK